MASMSMSPPEERARDELVGATRSPRSPSIAPGSSRPKGVLMLIYRIDADAALDLLRWRSQQSNIKLRRLAAQIIADFSAWT